MTHEQRDFLRKRIDAQVRERLERARSAKAQARAQARAHEAGSVILPVDPHKTESLGSHSRVQDQTRDQTKYYTFNLLNLTFDA